MGKTHGPYQAEYPVGSMVKIVSRAALELFMRDWQWHNKLQPEQLDYAGTCAVVESVAFYHRWQ
jgi:hypothetical protein